MALTSVEIVRLGIGDTDSNNEILSDDQIQYFLSINDGSTDNAITDAQIAMSQILSIRAVSIRAEDLWEDNRDAAKRYQDSLDKVSTLKGSSAYPIIGGCSSYPGPSVNQFDDDNDYDNDELTFFNEYETDA